MKTLKINSHVLTLDDADLLRRQGVGVSLVEVEQLRSCQTINEEGLDEDLRHGLERFPDRILRPHVRRDVLERGRNEHLPDHVLDGNRNPHVFADPTVEEPGLLLDYIKKHSVRKLICR